MNRGDAFLPPHFCEERGRPYGVSHFGLPRGVVAFDPRVAPELIVSLHRSVRQVWDDKIARELQGGTP